MAMLVAIEIVALLAFAAVGRRSLRYTVFLRTTAIAVGTIFALQLGASLFGAPPYDIGVASALVAVAALLVALAGVARMQGDRRRWLTEAEDRPLVLEPPFDGRWRAVAGGPNPGTNHHLIASDQRFAYDFVRCDGPSLGERIFAPVAGRVVASRDGRTDHAPSLRVVEDAEPLGNYVAIDSGSGVVFLCHLKNGSVGVRAGDSVIAGQPIGRCGNSGRTTRPHLHVHAQDLPHYAFDRARGLPIAFTDGSGRRVPRAGDAIGLSP